MKRVGISLALILVVATACAFDICLPTANDALLRPDREAAFFQPTVEGTVESGMFGCVRRGSNRFHEGIDVRCLQRDRRGEPTDSVHAVADGEVAFINRKSGLSNYGRYIVLQHRWDGVQVFTLYAHLRDVASGLVVGQPVRRAQRIGTLGRSTNTRERIHADRAHLHFEINFMLNQNFRIWYPIREPNSPPFGNFNGKNLLGIDPAALLRARAANPKLNFAEYVARQPIAFTVLVGARPFPWLKGHPEQIVDAANVSAPACYEVGVTAWGLPVAVWPRASAEGKRLPALSRINEQELAVNNCRRLITQMGRTWQFTSDGREWLDLMLYSP